MKLAFMADTHGHLPTLYEEVDIVFHCGDICPATDHSNAFQSFWVQDVFYPWFASLPAKHKVFISGNHDFVFQTAPQTLVPPPEGVTYLEHNSCEINGLKIFGSPWQPWFYNWAWNAPYGPAGEIFMKEKWKDIPGDTNILLTHCPPYGILDAVETGSGREGERVGCKELLNVCNPVDLPQLKIAAFGHIHENPPKFFDAEVGITFINAAFVDNQYRLLNKPVIMEI